MDVCENETQTSLSYSNFKKIMDELQIPIQPETNTLVGELPNTGPIRVACLYFEKKP